MADISATIKDALAKGMEALGSAANSIASSTRFKVDEMNLVSRRNELLSGFGAKAYEVWKGGARLPEELEQIMRQVGEVDEQLARLRQERVPREEPLAPTLQVREEAAPAIQPAAQAPVEPGEGDDALPTLDMPEMVTRDEVTIEAEEQK